MDKPAKIDVARNINKTTLAGRMSDAPLIYSGPFSGPYNNRFVVDIPYTVSNPSNIPWEIKSNPVTINGVSRTATSQLLYNANHPNGAVSYVRLTIPYAENETTPTNPTCEYTINIGHVGNATVLDSMTQVTTVTTDSVFYGYDYVV